MIVFVILGDVFQGGDCVLSSLLELLRDRNIRFDHARIEDVNGSFVLMDFSFPLELINYPVHHYGGHILATLGNLCTPFGSDLLVENLRTVRA